MKIVRAAMRPFMLPLVRPIATAQGTLRTRQGFLISVEDTAGRVAHGEATPLPEFGTEDLRLCAAFLRQGLSAWLSQPQPQPFGFGSESGESGRPNQGEWGRDGQAPCARAALEAAFCDLSAQTAGESLATWIRRQAGLAGDALGEVSVQALVQGAEPAEVEASARSALDDGFGTFKLKLAVDAGRRDMGLDLERVAALRAAVGGVARVRLDANEAWTRKQAEHALARLAEFQIDYVEQPVAREALADLAALGRLGGIGVAADEALLGEGLGKCLDARAASILIVKPAALGGISAALALVERAREEGLRIIWSNLFEGVVGRAVALALAAGTADEAEVHGLGTAGLLARDLEDAAGSDAVGREEGGRLSSASLLSRARRVPPAWTRPRESTESKLKSESKPKPKPESKPSQDADVWDGEVWEAEA